MKKYVIELMEKDNKKKKSFYKCEYAGLLINVSDKKDALVIEQKNMIQGWTIAEYIVKHYRYFANLIEY